MGKKFPPKKITVIWNDIRSGHRPRGQRMLWILSAGEMCIGMYDSGKFQDGDGQCEIPDNEVEGWAYLNFPKFD